MTEQERLEKRKAQAGFTLLEILIAIALLAAIAGLLVTNLDRILGGGREQVARLFVEETLETPLTAYRVNMGRYPSTEEGLEALVKKPSDEAVNWRGPYVKKLNPDPWGTPYQYAYPGERNASGFDLWSLGPDGIESEDDIGNWVAGSGEEL
ncbi:Type II secretion system protein G [Pontiella desulfatans]|uniref:Type II secretion system protein G n=1 Tax=Pontiella desulfatans TaxID=2750659 RepID=A0A6C2U4D9_PONDE|nr:type II secretion system major pseudopilin GspG [Pontiella desulfatans]VGO14266.1 Type II secretion system protein G [Pontiella desulfatans]